MNKLPPKESAAIRAAKLFLDTVRNRAATYAQAQGANDIRSLIELSKNRIEHAAKMMEDINEAELHLKDVLEKAKGNRAPFQKGTYVEVVRGIFAGHKGKVEKYLVQGDMIFLYISGLTVSVPQEEVEFISLDYSQS